MIHVLRIITFGFIFSGFLFSNDTIQVVNVDSSEKIDSFVFVSLLKDDVLILKIYNTSDSEALIGNKLLSFGYELINDSPDAIPQGGSLEIAGYGEFEKKEFILLPQTDIEYFEKSSVIPNVDFHQSSQYKIDLQNLKIKENQELIFSATVDAYRIQDDKLESIRLLVTGKAIALEKQ